MGDEEEKEKPRKVDCDLIALSMRLNDRLPETDSERLA
jgi:hypothetical protein